MVSSFNNDDDGVVSLLARFQTDQAANKRVLAEFEKFSREFRSFAKETEAVNRVLEKQVAELQQEKIAAERAAKSTETLADSQRKVRQEVDRTTQSIERQSAANIRPVNLREQVSAGGDVSTNLGAVSALGRLGGADIGILQDFSDLIEQLPLLKQSISGLPTAVRAAVSAIGIGPLGLIGVLGALAIAVSAAQRQFELNKEAAKEQLDFEGDLQLLRQKGTSEDVLKAIEQARDRQEQALADVTAAEEALAQLRENLTEDELLQAKLRARLNVSGDQNAAALGAANEALESASAAASNATLEITRYNALLGDENILLNDVAALQEDYNEQLDKSRPRLDAINQQQAQIIENYERQLAVQEEDARLRDRFQREDRQLEDERRAERHQQSLASIEQAGNNRIEALREDSTERLADLEATLNESIATISSDLQKSISEENETFRRDELKRAREFRRAEQKAAEDYLKERKRRLEDDQLELLEAEQANDAAAFIAAQRRQRQTASRAQEDFEASRSERRAEFDEERRERQRAKNERIADLRAEAAERTRVAREEFAKEKAALQEATAESIEIERAAIAERTQAAIDAYRRESDALIESRERADQRQAILAGVQQQRQQAAHQQTLNQIEQRRQAETSLFTDILIRINSARNSLSGLGSTLTPSGIRQGGRSITAFADGGIATRPTLGMFGERPGYHEALIPYRPSEGIERAIQRLGLGGNSVTVEYNHYGDISDPKVTVDQLRTALSQVVIETGQGLAAARYGRLS